MSEDDLKRIEATWPSRGSSGHEEELIAEVRRLHAALTAISDWLDTFPFQLRIYNPKAKRDARPL